MSQNIPHAVHGLGRKLLIVAMAGTFGLGLSGCNDDNETTNVAGNGGVTDRPSPRGTVVGQVVDNNGNPLAGVGVSIPDGAIQARALVTTGADGQFSIANVVVCETADAGGSGNGECEIPLFIDGPAGHLNASVTVSPRAQISNAQPAGGGGQTNPQLVFSDGFTASAGIIPLPKNGVTVTGVLRNEQTGEPIVGQNVVADFRQPLSDNRAPYGVVIQYGETSAPVNTGADGSFTITGIAEDSCYALAAQGLELKPSGNTSFERCDEIAFEGGPNNGGQVSFATRAETSTFNLGRFVVEPSNAADTEAPFVENVREVILTNANTGELASSFTDTFTIEFSEALAAGSPTVRVTTAKTLNGVETVIPLASGGVTLSGNVLTVRTSSPIGPNLIVRLSISVETVSDTAGNALADVDFQDDKVDFDSSANGRELVLRMRTANPPTAGLAPVTALSQVINAPANGDSEIFASTSSLIDVFGEVPPYNQLNAPAAVDSNPDTVNKEVAFTGLETLLHGLREGEFGYDAEADEVDVSTALVAFTTSGAREYAFVLVHADGSTDAPNILGVTLPASGVNRGVDIDLGDVDEANQPIPYPTIVLPDTAATQLRIALNGAVPGDVLRIVSIGYGSAGASERFVQAGAVATLPLVDHVAPTVGTHLITIAASGASGSTGSGGSLVTGNMVSQGTVIYPFSPQLYDRDDDDDGFADDELDGANELEGLSNALIRDDDGTTQYDATGASAFLAPLLQTIGVNVTEPLSTAATQPLATLGAGASTVLSSPGVVNDSADELGDEGFGPYYLYTVRVNSIENLHADARAKRTLNLTGIVDQNNVAANAATRAVTRLADVTPPIMTRAFYDGQRYVFQFNESVRLTAGQIVLNDCGVSIDLAAASDTGVAAANRAGYNGSDRSTVIVPSTNPQVANGGNACFAGPAYAEARYSDAQIGALRAAGAPAAAATPQHGAISYATVQDEADNSDLGISGGNNWTNWALNGLGISAPTFFGANVLGPIQATSLSCVGFTPRAAAGVDGFFDCDIVFSHPLEVADFSALTSTKLQVESASSTGTAAAGYAANGTPTARRSAPGGTVACAVVAGNTNQCNAISVRFTVTGATPIVAGDRVNMVPFTTAPATTYNSNLDDTVVARDAQAPNRTAFRASVGNGGVAQ